jgi:hypothetical protein
MFAAILNSFFIVLLSMVFVQRKLVEINTYLQKNFEMSTKTVQIYLNVQEQQRNITEFVQKYTLFIFLRLLPILNQNLFRCVVF